MGLGISARFANGRALAFLKPTLDVHRISERFYEIARRAPIVGPLAVFDEVSRSEFRVQIMPMEEGVEFKQDRQHVVLSARTSSVGPGYHHHLVRLIDELVRSEKLSLRDGEDQFDETGYLPDRSFSKLQDAMKQHFHAVSRMLMSQYANDDKIASVAISMSLDTSVVGVPSFAMTPRGPRDRAFFAAPAEAAEFFPWWGEGFDSASCLGLAESLMWTEFPWRRAANEREEAIENAISALIEKIDDKEALPPLSQTMLSEFNATRMSTVAPQATGIGYKRYNSRRQVTGGWSLEVPGYFLDEFDQSDGVVTFWLGKRLVHVSTLRIEGAGTRGIDPFEGNDVAISKEIDGLQYRANIEPFEGEGWVGRRLWGAAIAEGELANITVIFDDPTDRDWAIETLCSLRRSSAR